MTTRERAESVAAVILDCLIGDREIWEGRAYCEREIAGRITAAIDAAVFEAMKAASRCHCVCQFDEGRLVRECHYHTRAREAAVAEAVAAEREACARLADAAAEKNWGGEDADTSPEAIAAAIRASGQKSEVTT